MAKLSDTKIPMTEFLEAYRRQPILYNSMMDTYKNRCSREQACEAIIKSLNIPQLTVSDIKLKIKSVRTVYTKELRILLREKELGRTYEPKLFWFKLADSFLRSVSLSSHCKRLKNKHSNSSNNSVKKELQTSSDVFNEEMLEDPYEDYDSDSERVRVVDSYANIKNHEAHADKSVATNNHNHSSESNCIISMSQKDLSSVSMSPTATIVNQSPHKNELIIEDPPMCIIEQQPQQQPQTTIVQRRYKYAAHTPSSHQRVPASSYTTPQQPELVNGGICFASINETANNAEEVFGQSVASQLRSIADPYARSVAKLRIQQVLFDAETGQFRSADKV